MNYDKKCKWHKSCGYDFCHGEGICPEFEKGKPPKETEKESEGEEEVALQIMKKWNGEGGCKYCKTPPEYLAICQNYETRIFVGISGEYLQIFDEDYPGFCDNHKINFCPMCGRKLG